MHLDEHVEIELAGLRVQLGQRRRLERRDDEQDRVGLPGRGLHHLVRVDDEVLAQDRDLHGGAGAAQIGEVAPEVRLVGEDRDAGGTAGLVGLHDLLDLEVLPDAAGRGRAALVFGDHGHARAQQRLVEAARLVAFGGERLEVGVGHLLGAPQHVLAGALDDLLQLVHD